jgi:hypothetical protein
MLRMTLGGQTTVGVDQVPVCMVKRILVWLSTWAAVTWHRHGQTVSWCYWKVPATGIKSSALLLGDPHRSRVI